MNDNWMIYGAYGFTGQLVAEEAIGRGHRPVLGGRSAGRLAPLAERLGLESLRIDVNDEAQLGRALGDFDLVFHAAGPFTHTAIPMVRACLAAGANYLDVAAEPLILEQILSLDAQARQQDVALIPGAGFDVIATDCLSRYVSQKVIQPTQLTIATAASFTTTMSPGSAKTFIDNAHLGILVRKQGQLVRVSARQDIDEILFLDGKRPVVPASLGDLVTAYHSTGIDNIAAFTAMPERNARGFIRNEPVLRTVYASPIMRRMGRWLAQRSMRGPDRQLRQSGRSQVWVCATNERGQKKQAWLETMESYRFTAVAGVRCVEKLLTRRPRGALTPALAFGTDFIREIPETRWQLDSPKLS